ncbi:MAG UNVERIFIED_CONTAM: hypothetical protein LVT10_24585 [Anaerolineae bacterium]
MAPLTTVVNTYGGRWFDENWEPQINSPEWNEAVSFYVSLIQDCAATGRNWHWLHRSAHPDRSRASGNVG